MIKAPKGFAANIAYRQKLLKLAADSTAAREEILLQCQRDPIFFINAFAYTFDPQHYPDAPERPLILWPHQETAIKYVLDNIGVAGGIFPKSRRMGVTTLILAAFFWRWRFKPMQSFLLLSAKEDRVDKKGDPSCLFWKLDHYNDCLPEWMRVPVSRDTRSILKFINPLNGSVINGESTNADADRGGVRTAVLADEVASMPNASEVLAAVQPLSNSVFLVSTPKGAHGAFYELYEKWSVQAPERIVRLHWTQHPRFSEGLYYDADGKPRSPWYDQQCVDALGPRWIAQELDIGFAAAGGQYYESSLIDRLLKETVREPSAVGELGFDALGENPRWMLGGASRLKVWFPISATNPYPPKGEYVIGCDICQGTGGEKSSQSVASVVNKTTGEKVALFNTPHLLPTQFGEYVSALGRWFDDATVIWGRQLGGQFAKSLNNCRYHRIYHAKDKKPGFVETPESKLTLHSEYQDALHKGRFINRSRDSLNECRQYIFANGTVEHSKAVQGDADPENKGKLHGDLVVADVMANVLLPVVAVTPAKPVLKDPPYGSFAWRMKQHETPVNPYDWSTIEDA